MVLLIVIPGTDTTPSTSTIAAEPGGVLQHWAANDAVLLREDALHGECSLPQNHERGLPFGADPLRATPHQHVLVLQRLSQLANLNL